MFFLYCLFCPSKPPVGDAVACVATYCRREALRCRLPSCCRLIGCTPSSPQRWLAYRRWRLARPRSSSRICPVAFLGGNNCISTSRRQTVQSLHNYIIIDKLRNKKMHSNLCTTAILELPTKVNNNCMSLASLTIIAQTVSSIFVSFGKPILAKYSAVNAGGDLTIAV